MKRAILISIRPEWVEKILNGEKTIEIRKTAPKCELPIDVYIYCTKKHKNQSLIKHAFDGKYRVGNCVGSNDNEPLNGKIVAKFTLDDVFITYLKYCRYGDSDWAFILNAGLTIRKVAEYLGKNKGRNVYDIPFYAWHISDLEIFDQPKELSDLFSLPETYHHDYESMVDYYERKEARRLKRAPESWCYVEEK